ncbi:unnamed protein product [Dovyalis caffra]|uniref:Peptidase C19 ubiquitin carboxyl-terminal hydrolase domain-containing protein n=1 Tax=Dovyalis caffra TaxID=77055 RepID=A0AAV1RSD8_9ROSI|nr:unnamed protein product [Dovyalis caffra]
MNDADELLQNIFGILHQSFTSSPAPDTFSSESHCTSDKCLAHRLFGIDISGYCESCGQLWRHQTFSDFSHSTFNHEGKSWTMYDDAYVEVIGCWQNLLDKCVDKLFQLRILFFESDTFPCSDLYSGDIKAADFDSSHYSVKCPELNKCPQFDDLRKFSGRSSILCNPGVGEVKQGPSAEGIPEESKLHNDQTAKDGGGDLQSDGQNEMKILNQDIIQPLWQIPQFRNELTCKSASEHKHVGHPSIFRGLAEILVKLSAAHINTRREIVSPTFLSIAIDKFSSCGDLFQEGKMNNAFEVLQIILDHLHQSLASNQEFSLPESEKRNHVGSLECTSVTCLARTLFVVTLGGEVHDKDVNPAISLRPCHKEVIGSWDSLCNKSVKKHFLPQILFFVEWAPPEMHQKLPRESDAVIYELLELMGKRGK